MLCETVLRLNLGESHSLMLYFNVVKRKDNETVMVSRTKCSNTFILLNHAIYCDFYNSNIGNFQMKCVVLFLFLLLNTDSECFREKIGS